MDQIAIHLGTSRVRLCKWDGRRARVRSAAADSPVRAWSAWLELVGATDPHEAIFRCTSELCAAECRPESVRVIARAAGARWLRYLVNPPVSDSGLAAARHLAGTTRWTTILSIERDELDLRFGLQDRRGRIAEFTTQKLSAESPSGGLPLEFIASLAGRADGIICLGDAADEWATRVRGVADGREVMVPGGAAVWPLLGMMIAPIEQQFERALSHPEKSESEVRAAFVELMDEAGDAVTREGYDLDDSECERFVDLAESSAGHKASVPLSEWVADNRGRETSRGIEPAISMVPPLGPIRAIRIRVVISPPSIDWPADVADHAR